MYFSLYCNGYMLMCIVAVGHAFLGSAYLSCLLLFSTLVFCWRIDIIVTGKPTTVSSRAVDLRVWNPLINGIIIYQTNLTSLPMIRFCHSSIRYNMHKVFQKPSHLLRWQLGFVQYFGHHVGVLYLMGRAAESRPVDCTAWFIRPKAKPCYQQSK